MILTIIFSLVLVAIFSAAETSFVAADKVALTVNSGSGFEANSVFFFLKQNELFFATVVVASSLAITTFSSVSEIFFHEGLGVGASVLLPLTTLTGFIFGELIPKSLALESPETTAQLILPFVRAFYFIANPLVNFTADFSKFIVRVVLRSPERTAIFQKRDVYRFLGESVSSGYLDKIESDIIRRLLVNANLPVRNFCVPRTQLIAVDIRTEIDKLRELFEKTGKTKVIIYDSSIDNIVGVVHAKHIFKNVDTIEHLVSDVIFVPESISVLDVLEEFRAERVYSAIVIDEFGGTAGLVTSSDIMEIFLGDVAIWTTEEDIKQISSRQFLLHGNTSISEAEKILNLKFPKGDFTTISGLVVSHAGRIPMQGERIQMNDLEFQILKSDGRKLETVKLTMR
ncbi:MAG TPA: hemolysin family protein [Candidatus Acidoferrales bacterium]|nr:hemolysin family protein [Candidatus Acidoferrales bacterium]